MCQILQNKKAIILVGNSGSGKSTFSKSVEGFKILSKDKIREDLMCSEVSGCRFDNKKEQLVNVFYREQLKFHANTGINLLIDETHTTLLDFNQTFVVLKNREYEITIVNFDISVDICLKRNENRKFPIPEDVIRRKQKELEEIRPYIFYLNRLKSIKLEVIKNGEIKSFL
jgi:predicted kinase